MFLNHDLCPQDLDLKIFVHKSEQSKIYANKDPLTAKVSCTHDLAKIMVRKAKAVTEPCTQNLTVKHYCTQKLIVKDLCTR